MFSKDELNKFFSYSMALTKNEQSAFDLLQDSLEKFVGSDTSKINNIHHYFFRMLRNQFIDELRKNKNIQTEEFNEEQLVLQFDVKGLDEILVDREEAREIFQLLSPIEREILFMWAVEGFTTQDIAEYLGIPTGTLLSKLHRLKIRVRNRLQIVNESRPS